MGGNADFIGFPTKKVVTKQHIYEIFILEPYQESCSHRKLSILHICHICELEFSMGYRWLSYVLGLCMTGCMAISPAFQ